MKGIRVMPAASRVVGWPAEPGPFRIDEIGLPDPSSHQVVVKQFASGVFHSQLLALALALEIDGLLETSASDDNEAGVAVFTARDKADFTGE